VTASDAAFRPAPEPTWPVPPGEPVVFVSEVTTPTERQLLEGWIGQHRPPETPRDAVRIEHFDRPRSAPDILRIEQRVQELLDIAGDPWFAPVRVGWLPQVHKGGAVRLRDVVALGDPRRPRPMAQRWLATRHPDRIAVVSGGAARLSWLNGRWKRQQGSGKGATSFPRFLLIQAVRSVERAEADRLGAPYRVPRLVREDLASSARFHSGLADLAAELDRPLDELSREASHYLDEMVTGYGQLLIDLTARFGRFVYRQGYEPEPDYDPSQVETVRRALAAHPAVILPTHKSMLDPMVMPAAFRDLDLPRSHTLGGINLAFWPMGSLMRRSGVIFIRRRITDNPVYRFVLREYIGYLIARRFNLEWYIEGGRTRTGKLLPPRLGLLAYVADAYWQGRVDDILLLPVSIAYDHLHEVGDFAHEARGGAKRQENLRWMVDYIRAQRFRFGRIYVRFGEPVSMRSSLGPPPEDDSAERPDTLALQKMAFEVAVRINKVTPITGTSLVVCTLLGARGRALTVPEIERALSDPLDYVRQREFPLAESARQLDTRQGLSYALDELRRHGVVTAYPYGPEPVYCIEENSHHAAAFYRNSIIHFFVLSAIGELALLHAGDAPEEPVEVFWFEAFRLRDLLKFDFFFFSREEFRGRLAAEMTRRDPTWQVQLEAGGHTARAMLGTFRPLCAPLVLRPFLEAYQVVADSLAAWSDRPGQRSHFPGYGDGSGLSDDGEPSDAQILAACQARGRQYLMQRRIRSPEAVSAPLFATGLQLATNRLAVRAEPGERHDETLAQLAVNRRALVAELHSVLRALGVVESVANADFEERVRARVALGAAVLGPPPMPTGAETETETEAEAEAGDGAGAEAAETWGRGRRG
jgi:glycerol-3-phosphate O-acyltransferase